MAASVPIRPDSQSSISITLQSALAAPKNTTARSLAARLGRAADLAGIDVAVSARTPRRRSKRDGTRRTKCSAWACRSNSAASVSRRDRRGQRDARTHNGRDCGSDARYPSCSADRLLRAGGRATRRASHHRAARVCRTNPQCRARSLSSRARRPGSSLCRRNWRWRTGTTNRRRPAGGSEAARVELNTLIGRSPDAPADPTDNFDAGVLPADLAAAIAASPDIVAIDRQIDEAVARERLARAMRTPDSTMSGGVLFDSPAGLHVRLEGGVRHHDPGLHAPRRGRPASKRRASSSCAHNVRRRSPS